MAIYLNLQRICLKALAGAAVILSLSFSSYAEEPRVFTDDDLSGYSNRPMVDEETARQKEESLKSWEKTRDEESLKERKDQEIKEARAKRQTTVQRQAPAIAPRSVYAQTPYNGQRTAAQSRPGVRRT